MADTMKALQTITVTGSASDIQFTSIPQTYTDLYVVISAAGRLTSGTAGAIVVYSKSGQSSVLSNWRDLRGSGTSVTSSSSAYPIIGVLDYQNTNTFSSIGLYVSGYTSNTQKNIFLSDSVTGINGSTAISSWNSLIIDNTDPISFLGFGDGSAGGGLKVGSTITIYGIFNKDVSTPPSTPTIGTASDAGTSGQASVAFTGVSNAASYTMTSSPGSITATGSVSPIIVSGLTNGTSYTFTCQASNPFGTSAASAASNSVTPTAGYTSIATVSYASGNGGDVQFVNIPNTYRHLQVRMFMRDTRVANDSTWFMQFNYDTGNNYSYQGMGANGSTISNVTSTSTNSMQGITSGSTAGANRFGSAVIDIFDVNQTNKFKTSTYQSGYTNNGSGNVYLIAGTWRSTSAINTIVIKPNTAFAQYSHFALYGMG